jgi:hypothetical protein
LTKIKLRSYFNPILDFELDDKGQRVHLDEEVTKFIEEHPICETLSYNVIQRKHILMEAVKNKDIVEAILFKLELTTKADMPFLFPGSGVNAEGDTAFDLLVREN